MPIAIVTAATSRWDLVPFVCALALPAGVAMTGIGLAERRRQQHFGHYSEAPRRK